MILNLRFEEGVYIWIEENVNGDGSLVEKEFETYQEVKAYAKWTYGAIRYVKNLRKEAGTE